MLRWASTTDAVTFDPHAATLVPTVAENHQVYEGLVDLIRDAGVQVKRKDEGDVVAETEEPVRPGILELTVH